MPTSNPLKDDTPRGVFLTTREASSLAAYVAGDAFDAGDLQAAVYAINHAIGGPLDPDAD